MKSIIFSTFTISFLDALTTYILVATGRGMEVNPIIAEAVNAEPASVFIICAASVALIALSFIMADKVLMLAPTVAGMKMRKVMYIAFGVAASWRAAVVINNFTGIVMGVTPLADLFVDA
jgi:hypothetical protein